MIEKIGFGGGCHWCTEAVFQVLKGVERVEQGWIASKDKHNSFSEAVIVHYNNAKIDLETLTSIHLYTHSCTSQHSMRKKYRSAVYIFSELQAERVVKIIDHVQSDFDKPIVTQVLPFVAFRENIEQYQNYFLKNSENSFCKTYINPKFSMLMREFSKQVDLEKLAHI